MEAAVNVHMDKAKKEASAANNILDALSKLAQKLQVFYKKAPVPAPAPAPAPVEAAPAPVEEEATEDAPAAEAEASNEEE